MSLSRLRTFIEVYRHRSISAAARSLGFSQPAVSQHIAGLEAAIGRSLFERSGNGVAPTAAAHDLAGDLSDHLDAAEAALAGARARSMELAGAIHLVGQSDFLSEYVSPLLAPMIREGMLVRLHPAGPGQLESSLLDGQADLGIAVYPIEDKRLRSQLLLTQRLVAVASPSIAHGVAQASDLHAALDELPLFTHSFKWPTVNTWLESQGLPHPTRPADFIGHNLHSLRTLASSGYGWAVLPEYYCRDDIALGRLAVIEGPGPPPVSAYYLVWTPSALRNPRTASARQMLIDSFGRTSFEGLQRRE